MKYFIISLLLFNTMLYAQDKNAIIVNYQNISLVDLNSLDPEFKSDPDKMRIARHFNENYEKSKYTLEVKDLESLFETQIKMSISDKPDILAEIERKKKYYVNQSVFLEQIEFLGELLLIEEKSNSVKWELSSDTKDILGFKCYKAEYTKNGEVPIKIEAWYAPELPFNFGPKGHHGLPGLILETIQNDKLSCKAFSLIYDEDVYVIKPTSGKKITREDFNKKVDDSVKFMLSNSSDN